MTEYDKALPVIRELYVVSKKVRSERSKSAVLDAIEMIEDISVRLDDALLTIDYMEKGIAK